MRGIRNAITVVDGENVIYEVRLEHLLVCDENWEKTGDEVDRVILELSREDAQNLLPQVLCAAAPTLDEFLILYSRANDANERWKAENIGINKKNYI